MEGREEERKLRSKGRDTRTQESVERREDRGEEKIGRMRKKETDRQSQNQRDKETFWKRGRAGDRDKWKKNG